MKFVRTLIFTISFLLGANASAQSLSDSKLSIHLINNYSVGSSNIVSGRPRVLKVLAHTNGFPSGMLAAMRDYKTRVPSGKLLVRVYSPKHYFLSDNPTTSAADYWTNHLQSALNTLSPADKALIDYLEGPNEGDTPTLGYPNGTNALASSLWFNEFWTNMIPKIVNAGLKPCLGSIAVGNPGSLSDLDPFIPALRQAKAAGGAWSYHSYTINYTTDVGVEWWYSLRYRQFYNYFAEHYPDLVDMPLILTEGGVDFSGNPNTSGWQARGPASHYQRWLNWFDQRMKEDSYLLGCTLFQNGDPSGWSSFEIEPIANWLGSYLTNPSDFPSAPTGLSATVINGNVQLAWTSIPTTPLTYTVKRASTNGTSFTTLATGITEGISSTSFTDTSPFLDRPSRYVVSAVSAFGESDNSAEVPVTANPINSIPSAPSNLTASVGSGHVALQWTIPAGATSFNVKRSLSSGGPYIVIASNFYAATFKNCSYSVNTPYYYVVSAVNSLGESPNSNQVNATPTNTLPDAIVTALFWTNTSIAAGNSVFFRVTVKNQGSASIPASQLGIGFLVNGSQVSYVGAGNPVLAAGASATYIANGGGSGGAWLATIGNHTITAVADDINRFTEGDEENNAFSVPLSVYVPSYSVNCGGGAVGTFAADAHFSGSTNLFSVANAIDLTGASNAAPPSVYQSERWGPTKYSFANLVPGKIHKTRLHFAEVSPSVTQAGDRRFHVSINGEQVLTNFDIFAAAGAKFRAVTKPFNIAADPGGNIALHFWKGAANEPKINGIQIIPYTNAAPVLTAIGNKTVNAGTTLIQSTCTIR